MIACLGSPNRQGEILYDRHCSTCHGNNGEGLRALYPPLANVDYLEKHRAELSCIIKNGMSGPIEVNGKPFDMAMPGLPQLNAVEIHNIVNFICNSWGNDLGYFTPKEVDSHLSKCQESTKD